jgi:pyruvate dehydrogenase E2 component (dihydrolipoamide acetyltransferase)
MTDINVPKLGDGVDGAEILSILVQVGDTVSEGQSLLELESDKATVEVPSTAAGVVKSLAVAEGDTVSEGQLILRLEAAGEAEKSPEKSSDQPAEKPAKEAAEEPAKEVSDTPSAPAPQQASTSSSTLEIVIPKLGDGVDGAEVLNIMVSEGDTLAKGDALIELESDKATVEIPSEVAGVLKSLQIAVGDTVSEGQVIGIVESQGESSAQKPAEKPSDKSSDKSSEKSADTAAPKQASQNEPLPQGVTEPQENQPLPTEKAEAPTLGNPVPAAPSVRRFARELGVDIQQVKGTGPRGRISEADVKTHVKAHMKNQAQGLSSGTATQNATGSPVSALPAMPDFSQFGPVETEKMNAVRRATAQQMSLSWQNIPHVTQFDQADITELEVFRKAQGKVMEKAGAKLTVTAMLVKICAMALKKFPQFNASIDTENQQIIYKKYYNVGVAAETPRGLMVPVINDVTSKGFIDLSVELNTLAQKARDRKISAEELQGATFTISNLGGLGTTYFTPIVNWPQVAILGVGRASLQPVWQDNAFVPRMIMPLSISYDHRLIDGADAARFLRWIAQALESPLTMMMESENP